jgi:hypothetical protein
VPIVSAENRKALVDAIDALAANAEITTYHSTAGDGERYLVRFDDMGAMLVAAQRVRLANAVEAESAAEAEGAAEGEHGLVFQPEACGCAIVGTGLLGSPLTIRRCALHDPAGAVPR